MNTRRICISTLILLGFVFIILESRPADRQAGPISLTEENPQESVNIDERKTLSIGGTSIQIDIADEPAELSLGLSGRESLGKSEGLLFIFEKPAIYPFWMKEMRFPIDIIWIDENMRVADITHNAAPESFPKTFSPNTPVRYVLEVHSNFVEESHIKLGDRVIFSADY